MEQQTNRPGATSSVTLAPAYRLAAQTIRLAKQKAQKAAEAGARALRSVRLPLRPAAFVAGPALVAVVTAAVVLGSLRGVQASADRSADAAFTAGAGQQALSAEKIVRLSLAASGGASGAAAPAADPAAISVDVQVGGQTVPVSMTEGTVADALRHAGVTLGAEDTVNMPLDTELSGGETVIVRRVTYKNMVVLKPIPFATTTVQDILKPVGSSAVVSAGAAGRLAVTAKVKYVDGREAGRTVLSQKVQSRPVNRVVSVGAAAAAPVSGLTMSGLALDKNGVPLHYSHVYTGPATAYSARPGALTDSGRRAGVGYVAVDPSVIPYGSHLYIMTPGGSIVYGVAVAADTGTFVHDGSGILVDLYFPDFASECRFGEHTVNLYVLD